MEHVRRRPACGAVLVRVTLCTVSLVLAAPLVDAASDEAWLESYLDETFLAVLERVVVTDRKVTVSGRVDGNRDDLLLAEIPLERRGDDPQRCETTDPVAIGPDGRFTLTLDRFRDRGGLTYDRLTSRWQLVEEGIFAMPNVTHPEGVALYGGLLDLMAERWSRPDGRYGRVHHWIMHNEVDAGYEWTNCGLKPAFVFMDLLQRSLRLMHLIARRYDPHARTFISLTHHWAHPGKQEWYGSKRMLDLLVRFCDAEGDFSWAVAFHAYPQNVGNPRTWEDAQATFHFDPPKITPRNLEVLEAYLRQPRFMHAGQPRPIHFSENGFNSPDYGP